MQKNILIGDDSPKIRKALKTLLQRQDSWVVVGEAENGKDAVQKAKELSPDLVVLDLSMPVMSGIDASREMKRRWPKLPLVMFTNFAETELKEIALASGANAVVSKSEPRDLISKIYALLPS